MKKFILILALVASGCIHHPPPIHPSPPPSCATDPSLCPPPPVVLPEIQVDGNFFRLSNGELITLIGASDFCLYQRFLDGQDIQPVIQQRQRAGFNVLRVWLLTDTEQFGICKLIPADYLNFYEKIPDFLQVLAKAGLYAHLTVFTGAERLMPERDAQQIHLDRIVSAIRGESNAQLFRPVGVDCGALNAQTVTGTLQYSPDGHRPVSDCGDARLLTAGADDQLFQQQLTCNDARIRPCLPLGVRVETNRHNPSVLLHRQTSGMPALPLAVRALRDMQGIFSTGVSLLSPAVRIHTRTAAAVPAMAVPTSASILNYSSRVLIEMGNEWEQGDNSWFRDLNIPTGLIISGGSVGSEGWPVDFNLPVLSFQEFHTNGAFEWIRKVGHNGMELAEGACCPQKNGAHVPTFSSENERCCDRYNNTAWSHDAAAGASLLDGGSVFHSVHGKNSQLWDDDEFANAQAWVSGAKSVPLDCRFGNYEHPTDLEGPDDLRVYRRGGRADCVVHIRK